MWAGMDRGNVMQIVTWNKSAPGIAAAGAAAAMDLSRVRRESSCICMLENL